MKVSSAQSSQLGWKIEMQDGGQVPEEANAALTAKTAAAYCKL